MTSLVSQNKSSTMSSKMNSTFILEPRPPVNSLMNGCYSTTPESKSNFGTPGSLSRQGSANSILLTDESTSVPIASEAVSKPITADKKVSGRNYDQKVDDDDEDEDDDDDDDMGIVI